jgi:sugar lactone lactonase YvrE
VADPEPDRKPENRFNDGKCDAAGRFWAGTMSTVRRTGDARLYRLDPDLRVSERFGPVTTSNGLGWNPAGDTMYYIDTPRKQVLAFDYDGTTGDIGEPRVVVDTAALGIEGSPDGMAVDVEGRIWVAICHGGRVCVFDPGTGREVERILFPCIETTAPAFGGPDGKTLYVTTGIKPGLEEPLAGRLFAVEVPVRGLAAHAFTG